MSAQDPEPYRKDTYKTTRPILPPAAERTTLKAHVNDELSIELRPSALSDAEHIHSLRSQIEVMKNTSQGSVDVDLKASETWLKKYLPPNDKTTYNFSIWVNEKGVPWEHVGVIGVGKMASVSIVGYMIRREWWGRKVVSHAIQAWLDAWWQLEREVVELELEPDDDKSVRPFRALEAFPRTDFSECETSNGQRLAHDAVTPELLVSEVDDGNIASRKILARCKFEPRGSRYLVEHGVKRLIHVLSLRRPE